MADSLFIRQNLQEQTERLFREETHLLFKVKVHEQTIYGTSLYLYVNNEDLLHSNPFIFNIWHVCVVLHNKQSVCNKQSIRVLCTHL